MKKFFKYSSLILALMILFSFQIVKADGSNETIETSSQLQINLNNFPSAITAGNSYNIQGTIFSNFKITDVYSMVYRKTKNDSDIFCQASCCPKTTTFDIASSIINTNIKFGNLKVGNYVLCIGAYDETDKLVTIEKEFSIVAPVASKLKINLTSYPTKITAGSSYGLRGSISSNYKIRKVTGQIHKLINNEYKATTISSLDTPNSKYINIASANLNNNLTFGKLTRGQYRITITATDASGQTVTIYRYFRIVNIKINLTSRPTTITQGKSFGLRGDITCITAYPIEKVCGYITTINGTVKFSSVDYPNSQSMNIRYSNLNNKLSFGKLAPGAYLLKIKAQDTYGNTDEVTYQFVVTKK